MKLHIFNSVHMEEAMLDDSRASSSSFCSFEEEETSGSLNDACLLSDSEMTFGEQGTSQDGSFSFIPETPSPFICRRKRNSQVASNHSELQTGLHASQSTCSEGRDVPGYLFKTPSSQRTLKRRKLQNEACHKRESKEPGAETGFVLASALVPSNLVWLESPRSSQSSRPSSSTDFCAEAPSCSRFEVAAKHSDVIRKTSHAHANGRRTRSKGIKEKRNSATGVNHQLARCTTTGAAHRATACLPQNTDAEDGVDDLNFPVCQVQEDIILIDEDEDDVLVEATVRSIQVAEDEALARSLQEQFDREEQLHQEHRRLESQSLTPNSAVNSYVGLSWISPWAAMVNSAAFADVNPGRRGRQPRQGRGRYSRHRNAQNVELALLDESQGNNYEALLAFEESQGAVLKKNLCKEEIERLPTKVYNPAHNAGKTDCQICFSDYNKGEKLRMLPCFHDYHVKCIDRWLKENASCPICRAEVSV